ncbi:MAG: hypothetical protein R3B48_20735 [Kofleriaceae bacterium]
MSWIAAAAGLGLGLRHALEPDHVAAVATLLTGGPRRGSVRRGVLLGIWWGLGHAATLAASVATLSVLCLQLRPAFPAGFELAVSALLIAVGGRAIWRARRPAELDAPCDSGERGPPHPSSGAHRHGAVGRVAWRPFLVGGLHGLAGSGGMMVLLSMHEGSGAQVLGFVVAFVLGSIVSMAAVSAVGAATLGALGARARRGLMTTAGLASVSIGFAWAVPQLAALT